MKFDSIGDFFGISVLSQNNKFQLITSTGSSETPSDLLVADKKSKKPIYAYRVNHTMSTTVSNNGCAAGICYNQDTFESTIFCIDEDGSMAFKKISQSNPMCLTFDNNSQYLVVFFAGEDTNVECYSIVWFDVKTGLLIKAEQAPDITPVFEMHFNDDNKLILKTS